jgi:16S rRNA (guanine527-N7)-methyltransferase
MEWTSLTPAFGVELTPNQISAFETYSRDLIIANERVNLTAIRDPGAIALKHFLDSLSVAPLLRGAQSLIDIGSGAGFPGIALKIALPHLRVTLIEATGKKVVFLNSIISALRLDNIVAIQSRAEDLGHDPKHRERYGVAVARAVAELATLAEYALPFVQLGGIFIAQKGKDVDDEVHRAELAMVTLGGRLREIVPVELPGLERRHLIVIEKISKTSSDYPRRAGIPERKPL